MRIAYVAAHPSRISRLRGALSLSALPPPRKLAIFFRESPRKGFQLTTYGGVGRGYGVGRGRGVTLGVGEGGGSLAVGDGVGVTGGVMVGVGVGDGGTDGVTVGVGVGEGTGPAAQKTSVDAIGTPVPS